MVSYVVSLGRACVSAALIMFAAPLALGTAGFVLQSVLFSDAARFLVYRALVRIYFFCSSLSLAFSRSSLAFSLHLSARLCSRLFVQVSHRLSLSVSSLGRVCDVVLLLSPSSQAFLLRIFSAISSPTIPLRDIFETAIDWHSALPALATPSFQQSRSSFTGGVQHGFHLVVRTLWYPIRSLLLSYLWVHVTTLLVFFVVCALLLGFYLVYCNVPGLGPAALRTVPRVCGWLKAGATSLLARRRDLWLGRAGDDVKTAHAPVDAPWLPQDYPFALGFTFKYQLGKNLGRGTHGFVMQAQERWSGRQVAVKFVDATQSNRWPKHPQYGRCPREVLVGMLASHENIIQIIETFEDDRYFYIVQELFGDAWQPRDCVTGEPIPGATSGNSLREYIQHHGSVPLDTAHKIFKQLVSVISHLHSRGIAHCDIKPDNILIDRDANIRLIDLGSSISWLASNNDPNGPHEVLLEYFCSTIVYTAPEALKRCNGKRSCKPFLADVWALGVLLYEMVTGVQYPFRTEAMSRGGVESLTRFDELCQTKAVADVLPALRLCLEVKPSKRGTITRLAQLFPTSS